MKKAIVLLLTIVLVLSFGLQSTALAAEEAPMEIVEDAIVVEPGADAMTVDIAGEVAADEQNASTEDESIYGGDVEKFFSDGDFLYDMDFISGYAWISGYSGPGGAVTIPKTYKGWEEWPVGGIREDAFKYDTSITSVYIPDGLVVEAHSFYKCTNLKSVRFPDRGVYSNTFGDCTSLKSINTSPNWTGISSYAFYNTGFSSFTVPENVETIWGNAFGSCKNLKWVYIPEKTREIYDTVFEGCPSSMIIKGAPGSEAQRYAKAHGFKFESTLKPPPPPAAPTAPTGLKASSAAYNKLKVMWNSVPGAMAYSVYRSESKTGTYTKIGDAISTAFVESGLKTGKAYYYKVAAVSAAGEGKQSAAAGARPVVAAPKNLKGAGVSKGVKLTWTQSTGASGYFVYRCATKTGTYSYVKTVGKVGAYTDTKLISGKAYYYKVIPYRTVSGSKVKGKTAGPVAGKAK